MGETFFRVTHELLYDDRDLKDECANLVATYVPAKLFSTIVLFESEKDLDGRVCAYYSKNPTNITFPLYVGIDTDAKPKSWDTIYLIHPSENEHMERFLAGTANPMYDFVFELRNNPFFHVGC